MKRPQYLSRGNDVLPVGVEGACFRFEPSVLRVLPSRVLVDVPGGHRVGTVPFRLARGQLH